MRIAQLAAPWITVPPDGYGGTEWVVQQLCDGLTERGHEVVLYASGDSHTSAELRSIFPHQMPEVLGMGAYDSRHVSWALGDIEREGFDLIHDHSGFLAVAFSRYVATPMVHTVHCTFDDHAFGFYQQFRDEVDYVSVSRYQQSLGPNGMTWADAVYNAIAVEEWPFTPQKDDYLLAFGRVCHQKGFHLAIEAAKRTGHRLVMAGVLQEQYREYFETRVRPHIDNDQIVYESEVTDARKRELFAHAKAFLFPITWAEPFGLVMIEAMATGTPVVALRQGSVPEVVDHEVTGFICDDLDEFTAAISRVKEIDPRACRRAVEERFTVKRMIDGYEDVFRQVLAKKGDRSAGRERRDAPEYTARPGSLDV
jgi:glycosyltransferase involved in cell wall biosynthesis